MTVTEALMLIAAAATHDASSVQGDRDASLGVTATVVRPAEVSTSVSGGQVEAVTIADAAKGQVLADGGTVTQVDQNTRVVPDAGAGSLVVTIVY